MNIIEYHLKNKGRDRDFLNKKYLFNNVDLLVGLSFNTSLQCDRGFLAFNVLVLIFKHATELLLFKIV